MVEIERLQYILDKQIGWIAAADSRLSLVLPLSTAMIAALAAYATKPVAWTLLAGIPASFAIFFLCLSLIFCTCAAFPRTTGTKGSFIFFEGIISRDLSQYQKLMMDASNSTLQEDLLQQCYINAQIASSKFVWVRRAMTAMMVAMLPWAFAIFQFYGSKNGSL